MNVPLTVRFRIDLSDTFPGRRLESAEAWDAIRMTDGAFGAPRSPEHLAAIATRPELDGRARAIAAVAARLGAVRICSYGVGAGGLERRLLDVAGELELVCTDYAPAALELLRASLPEASFVRRDLRDGPLDGFDLHLFHRVDNELSNREWRRLLAQLREPALLVLAGFLDRGMLRRIVRLRLERRGARAGWTRTAAAWRRLLRDYAAEPVRVGDLDGFLVRPGGRGEHA